MSLFSILTSILSAPPSVSYSPDSSGSLSQAFPASWHQAGASPAAAGLQHSWIHDVKAH